MSQNYYLPPSGTGSSSSGVDGASTSTTNLGNIDWSQVLMFTSVNSSNNRNVGSVGDETTHTIWSYAQPSPRLPSEFLESQGSVENLTSDPSNGNLYEVILSATPIIQPNSDSDVNSDVIHSGNVLGKQGPSTPPLIVPLLEAGRPKKQKKDVKKVDPSVQKRKYSCSSCSSTFTALGSLKRHEFTHSGNPQPFSCDLCQARFTQASSLAMHKLRTHEGKRVYHQCHVCRLKFLKKYLLDDHLQRHEAQILSGAADESNVLEQITTPNRITMERLRIENSEVTDPTVVLLKCSTCDKSYMDPHSLKRHMTIHTGERPFQCTYCPKNFRLAYSLKSHINSHLHNKKHQSSYCDRRFRDLFTLKRHERGHTEKGVCHNNQRKMKQCKICLETTMTPFLFKKHFIERHHRESSVSLERLEIREIAYDSEEYSRFCAETNTYALCNICGNCYVNDDYRVHHVLCNKSIDRGDNIGDHGICGQIQSQQSLSNMIEDPSLPLNPAGNGNIINGDMILNNPRLFDEHDWVQDDNACYDYEHGDLLQLNIKSEFVEEIEIEICKLCHNEISKSCMTKHILEKHNEPVFVQVDRMMFKPCIDSTYRSISMVRPCGDTLNVPWYICGKCGRTFILRSKASDHKMYSCINKYKYTIIPIKRGESKKFLRRQWKISRLKELTLGFDGTLIKPEPVQHSSNVHETNTAVAATEKLDNDTITSDITFGDWTEIWTENLLPENCPDPNFDLRVKAIDGGKVQCKICDKILSCRKNSVRHMDIHDGKKWICEQCGTMLASKTTYESHLRIHAGERPFTCRICGKGFPCSSSRYIHEKSNHRKGTAPKEKEQKQYLCNLCSKIFNSTSGLRCHKKFIHPQNGVGYLVHCDQCPKMLRTRNGLRRHKIIFHSKDGIKRKFFGCAICDKEYSLIVTVKSHLRTQHADILPTKLLTQDTVVNEDGSPPLTIQTFFIRKFTELRRESTNQY